MDFHSLSRKDLQSLCKKNKIPANITNVAMADALTALDKVEGLDEFINAIESDSQKSPERLVPESPGIPRTACRTTTRRRQTNVESQSVVSTRRTTRRSAAEETDQENKNVNQLVTPAAPASRARRTTAAARQKTVTREEKSVQRAPSTRQSVRLLEKSMGEMSLKEKGKAEPVKFGGLEKEIEDIVEKEGDVPGSDKVSDEIVDKVTSSEDFSSQNQTVDNGNGDEDKLPGDSKGNEYEMENCSVKLDFDGEDNSGYPSGLDAKGEVDDDNIDKLNFPQFQDRNSENSINENEADPSTGEDNETMNDAVISEMAIEVNSNDAPLVVEMANDSADSAMEVKNPEIATSQDEEFTSANEIKDFLNLQSLVGDDSKISSIQGKQHDDLDVDSTFSIKVESDGKQLKKQENEAQELVQEQVSHPSEPVLCEKLASRDESEGPKHNQEYEECHQVSSDPVMEWAENNEPLADLDVINHEELNECSTKAESEVTQVSVNSTKADLEETKVPENHVSETSVDLHDIPEEMIVPSNFECPEEEMIVPSNFECPSTLNNPTATSKVISEMVSSSFAGDTFQGQFPRPTVSTPMKSPIKKDIALPMASHLADIDEESIDDSGRKLEAKKDEVNIMADEEIQYEKLSLRQLTKMVKEFQISKKNKEEKNGNKAAKTRLPLQRLPENCMTTTESGKEF